VIRNNRRTRRRQDGGPQEWLLTEPQFAARGIAFELLGNFSCARLTDGGNKPIAPPRNGFDEARAFRVVAENLAQFVNRFVQRPFGVDCGFRSPQHRLEYVPTDDLTGFAQQRSQYTQRLLLNRETNPPPTQFTPVEVEFEHPESGEGAGRDTAHGASQ